MTPQLQLCPKPERGQCNAQVLHQGSQVSACAIVKGTQRNLFVVPTAGTFEDEDLKSLEEEADADPSMKGQLMKKLHVSCNSRLQHAAGIALYAALLLCNSGWQLSDLVWTLYSTRRSGSFDKYTWLWVSSVCFQSVTCDAYPSWRTASNCSCHLCNQRIVRVSESTVCNSIPFFWCTSCCVHTGADI